MQNGAGKHDGHQCFLFRPFTHDVALQGHLVPRSNSLSLLRRNVTLPERRPRVSPSPRVTHSHSSDGMVVGRGSTVPEVILDSRTKGTVRPKHERYFSIPYGDLLIRPWQNRDLLPCVELISGVLKEYGLGWDPLNADRDVVDVEEAYQKGEFWVIEDIISGDVVGTAAFYEVSSRGEGVIEIRKMYLHKSVRGRGLGSFLLSALEQRAVQLGYKTAVIETASVLKKACELYYARGYQASEGLETERCDTILEKPLASVVFPADEDQVEAIDLSRGWSVTCVSRKRALQHGVLGRAVAILVQSGEKVLIHKRSKKKATYPGRISTLVTGCVGWMEDPLEAAKREVFEEIGLRDLEFREPFAPFFDQGTDGFAHKFQFHPFVASGIFNEDDIFPDPEEVESVKFMTRKEIIAADIGGSLWKEFRSRGA